MLEKDFDGMRAYCGKHGLFGECREDGRVVAQVTPFPRKSAALPPVMKHV
jgi:hypothetical protein